MCKPQQHPPHFTTVSSSSPCIHTLISRIPFLNVNMLKKILEWKSHQKNFLQSATGCDYYKVTWLDKFLVEGSVGSWCGKEKWEGGAGRRCWKEVWEGGVSIVLEWVCITWRCYKSDSYLYLSNKVKKWKQEKRCILGCTLRLLWD